MPNQFISSCSLGIGGFIWLLESGMRNSSSLWKCVPSSKISGSGCSTACACSFAFAAIASAPLSILVIVSWWDCLAASHDNWKWFIWNGSLLLTSRFSCSWSGSSPNWVTSIVSIPAASALPYQDFWLMPSLIWDCTPLIHKPCCARVMAT